MVIQVSRKFLSIRTIKKRLLLLAHLVHLLIRRMPFGLCNAPATFQTCMISIFADYIEKIMEVFMDDQHLVLNWEKCHFMVTEGIVLGHKISGDGIEVDPVF